MKRSVLPAAAVFLWAAVPSLAGDGVVALQTADPSCPDDSGDIYVDCGNGTVTDNRTGLVWLKNANCLGVAVSWFTATEFVAGLSDAPAASVGASHDCGLSDGSSPREWRLPSVAEWEAMIADAVALGCVPGSSGGPSITNDSGASCLQEGPGSSFAGVEPDFHWSSTTYVINPANALGVILDNGIVSFGSKALTNYVWPVRGGQ